MKKLRVSSFESRFTNRNRRGILLLVFAGLMTVAPACGKKGDPRAPELAVPETIRDLRGRVEPVGISLTWTRPTQYLDGKELKDLAGFVIFRKEVSPTCPDCLVPYRQRATVKLEDQGKFVQKKQYRFVDQELTAPAIYGYRVSSLLMDGSLSDPSNEVQLAWKP